MVDDERRHWSSLGSTEWMKKSKCRGASDIFLAPFAERPEARVRRELQARQICAGCAVIDACRDYARNNRESGFWGGENEYERAQAGFAPVAPIVGRQRIAETRALDILKRHRNL